jgi:Ala-tRNA(Pro) deacylase
MQTPELAERSCNCARGEPVGSDRHVVPSAGGGHGVALVYDSRDGREVIFSGGAMEISKQLIDFLNQNNVDYEILHHAEAVTAQRIAQAEHIKGRHQAKVVMIRSGDQHLMTVLPADHQIDLAKVEKVVGKAVSLDRENEFKSLFPDSAIGAMPPFGNLYGLPTLVDQRLAEQDYIVFEAGTHTDAIIMNYRDYEKIVNPKVEDLSVKLHPMKGA